MPIVAVILGLILVYSIFSYLRFRATVTKGVALAKAAVPRPSGSGANGTEWPVPQLLVAEPGSARVDGPGDESRK